jgi:hypothetical protein
LGSPFFIAYSWLISSVITRLEVLENYEQLYEPTAHLLITFFSFSYVLKRNVSIVGFEVHRAGFMKNSIFWDITPCSPLRSNRLLHASFFLAVLFKPEDVYVPPKRQLIFNGPHGVYTTQDKILPVQY